MRGELFIISAPAGGGKTTIVNMLLKEISNLEKVITCTTRKPRKGEKDKVDYFFLSKDKFEEGIKNGKFLEYAKVHNNYYGTPKDEIERLLNEGKDLILVIDVQGMKQIKEKMSTVSIFIIPPSLDELVNRMRKRGETDEEIKKRLETAKKEIPNWKHYDYIIINDILEKAKDDIKSIIISRRLKKDRFEINKIKDENLKELMENGE